VDTGYGEPGRERRAALKKRLLGRDAGPIRRRIHLLTYIAAHPGSTERQINEALWGDRRIRRTTTKTDLKHLAKTGLVSFKRTTGRTRHPARAYYISELGQAALSEEGGRGAEDEQP
jgi:predicted ArsR family transcriptional regulator